MKRWSTLFLVIIASMIIAAPALANTTSTVCNTSFAPKYWCMYVTYTPNSGFVSVEYLNFSGGLGGSADYFYVNRDEYWRQDPSTGTWYYLTAYSPSPTYTDCCLYNAWHTLGNGGYYVSDWAQLSAQVRHHKNDGTGFFCGEIQDFNLSSPSGVFIANGGGGGPC